jgi:hypothetical protein
METQFLAMWDCEGLECLFDITDMNHDMMVHKLQGKDFKAPFNLSMLMMRARYNSQRQYEIYTFSVEGELSVEEMKALFDNSPQYFVDLIREKGHKLYSDYTPTRKKVIA